MGFGRPPAYYFLWILPRNLISRVCGYIADLHIPSFVLKPLIKLFSKVFEVNLEESEKKISEFSVGLKFEDLPDEVINEVKRYMYDSIGCAYGAQPAG